MCSMLSWGTHVPCRVMHYVCHLNLLSLTIGLVWGPSRSLIFGWLPGGPCVWPYGHSGLFSPLFVPRAFFRAHLSSSVPFWPLPDTVSSQPLVSGVVHPLPPRLRPLGGSGCVMPLTSLGHFAAMIFGYCRPSRLRPRAVDPFCPRSLCDVRRRASGSYLMLATPADCRLETRGYPFSNLCRYTTLLRFHTLFIAHLGFF